MTPTATWLYEYDAMGNMIEAHDPSGTTTVTTFDQSNLPERVSVYSAPDRLALLADARFTYDGCGNVLSAAESIDAGRGPASSIPPSTRGETWPSSPMTSTATPKP